MANISSYGLDRVSSPRVDRETRNVKVTTNVTVRPFHRSLVVTFGHKFNARRSSQRKDEPSPQERGGESYQSELAALKFSKKSPKIIEILIGGRGNCLNLSGFFTFDTPSNRVQIPTIRSCLIGQRSRFQSILGIDQVLRGQTSGFLDFW
jgi:hypothetical protein